MVWDYATGGILQQTPAKALIFKRFGERKVVVPFGFEAKSTAQLQARALGRVGVFIGWGSLAAVGLIVAGVALRLGAHVACGGGTGRWYSSGWLSAILQLVV